MDLVRFRYGENNVNTGPLKEIPEICVDHFLGNDLNSCVFFLSHAHTDHLVGLETEEFMRRLRQPGIRLYCHPLTPILLGSFKRYLQGPEGIKKLIADRKIVPLDVGKPERIRIPRLSGHLDVQVTLLSAGHCPGSVMFLFETAKFRILHTGDFRLGIEDLKRMPLLHNNNSPKQIDHLYIDTTFCSKSANLFPNRKEVLKEAFDHVSHWLSSCKKRIVSLSFSAKFAHEYVLLEINRRFKQKIHVTPERLEIYHNIPEIKEICTLGNNTPFHLCGDRNCVEDSEVLTLRLSSMWYTKTKEENRDSFISWRGPRNMMLCYSMHSSLDEIVTTIDYLKPRIVTPLVLPVKTEMKEVYSAIRSATTSTFEMEDYWSSRNDFEGIDFPEVPCDEEKDETDVVDMDVEMENQDNDNEFANCSPLLEDEESPVKRFKPSDEQRAAWKYNFSPSPSSKNSQSSSEDGSQEINSQGEEHVIENFVKPIVPLSKVNPRRNLNMTDFSSDVPGTSENIETLCDEYDIGNDDPLANSQRL